MSRGRVHPREESACAKAQRHYIGYVRVGWQGEEMSSGAHGHMQLAIVVECRGTAARCIGQCTKDGGKG